MLSILHPAPIDPTSSSPLAIAPQILTKETRMVFRLIERKLNGRTTRQYTPSTSLNIFIDKTS